ncbi:MAG: EamA family transporter, partial [Burkholderiales bacterium]|nr:EamA family transporter [Burkholderiales bacterium]
SILGYSMPIFAALWGRFFFGDRLGVRQLLGVVAAGAGIALLLANEFGRIAGAPDAALAMIVAACIWGYGTHKLRRTTIPVPLLTLVFWMSALALVAVAIASVLVERPLWRWPSPATTWALGYNAVGVFVFANAAWFYLARRLTPVASSVSVMMIPVLGTFSGALWLGETLHWQDFAAMALMVLAIASVLLVPRESQSAP